MKYLSSDPLFASLLHGFPLLDPIIGKVHAPHGSVTPYGDGHGRVARVFRLAAECGEVAPIRRELLYTIVIKIGHKDIAFGTNGNGRRGGREARR